MGTPNTIGNLYPTGYDVPPLPLSKYPPVPNSKYPPVQYPPATHPAATKTVGEQPPPNYHAVIGASSPAPGANGTSTQAPLPPEVPAQPPAKDRFSFAAYLREKVRFIAGHAFLFSYEIAAIAGTCAILHRGGVLLAGETNDFRKIQLLKTTVFRVFFEEIGRGVLFFVIKMGQIGWNKFRNRTPTELDSKIRIYASAIILGALHLRNPLSWKLGMAMALIHTFQGVAAGRFIENYSSLTLPIAMHGACNLLSVTYLLRARASFVQSFASAIILQAVAFAFSMIKVTTRTTVN